MKVVILCGGMGTRLGAESLVRPKPLVEIGGKPVLWHIMKTYAHYGFKEFVLCLGYKGNMIKEYFLNYEMMNNDFTIKLGKRHDISIHSNHEESDWNVTLVDTGDNAMTGARIKRVEQYVDTDEFMVTYGDGVADIDLDKLIAMHREQGSIGTVTGVHPSSRFGDLIIEGDKVSVFSEKPQTAEGHINGGFFVFKKEFFKYLSADDGCYLEKEPLENLAADKELSVYKHDGFWQCMDTIREVDLLKSLWKQHKAPWKVW